MADTVDELAENDQVEKDTANNLAKETDENDAWDGDYGLSISPNDFNVQTLVDLIDRGKIRMPNFQRSYVWKKRQASKLIESLVRGLPVPQIFLYQDEDAKFLVIDGQQRLLSIYFFKNGRFPKDCVRGPLRKVLREKGKLDIAQLSDDTSFSDFKLDLPRMTAPQHRLHGKKYNNLLELDKDKLDLATFRTIIVKQLAPESSNSAMYEIFARLNTGGTNLTAQEIRMSLYNGKFIEMLDVINQYPKWRKIFGVDQPDPRMRDIEIILRGFAILNAFSAESASYKAPMTAFVNEFCQKSKKFTEPQIEFYKSLFITFCDKVLCERPFHNKSNKFSSASFDAVFTAACLEAVSTASVDNVISLLGEDMSELNEQGPFQDAINSATASEKNVRTRICIARQFIKKRE